MTPAVMAPADGSEQEVVLLAIRVAAWSLAAFLVPGVWVGWYLARGRSAARGVLHALVMLPLVLPPVVTGYLLLELLGRRSLLGEAWHAITGGHLSYTTGACVIAAGVVGFPLLVESVRLAVQGVDPRLEGVSRCLGVGRLATFFRVTLPLCLPGLLGGAVLGFARALGEFGATIILAGNIEGETRQIPLAVYTLLNQPGSEAAVVRLVSVSVALSLGALFLAFALQRWQRRRAGR